MKEKRSLVMQSKDEYREALGTPYIESAIGHLKDELVWLEEYTDFQQAYKSLSHFLDMFASLTDDFVLRVYNYERPHSSLSYLTPAEFETQYVAQK